MDDRQKGFKNQGKDADVARRQRANETNTLRKANRLEALLKRRNVGPGVMEEAPVDKSAQAGNQLPNLAQLIFSNDMSQCLKGTEGIRKMLSREENPPIDDVIAIGVLSQLCRFLTATDNTQLQLEAAWSLTNIASGSSEQTRTVVEAGAVPLFVQLVLSGSPKLIDQATWALGNIAGDGAECRDLVIECGGVQAIMKTIAPKTCELGVLKNAMWAMSNLCRGKNPQPDFSQVKAFLPAVAVWLRITQDVEIITDALWTLSYLSDGAGDHIEEVLVSGVSLKLVELMMHPLVSVVVPCLRTIGNITTGTHTETQVVINAGCVPVLLHVLSSTEAKLRKEACWAISNITAGTVEQIEVVLSNGLMRPLVHIAHNDEYRVSEEAMWAITNACCGGSPSQIRIVVDEGGLKQMCQFLSKDGAVASVLVVVMDAIYATLKSAENERVLLMYTEIIEEEDGIDRMDALQHHSSEKVYQIANRIISEYFSANDDNLELMEPEVGADGQLSFNAPAKGSNFNF